MKDCRDCCLRVGGKWQVSAAGGGGPRWRRDGQEILYLGLDNTLMGATVNGVGSAFEVGAVRSLFDTPALAISSYSLGPTYARSIYDVSPDGQRFLVSKLADEAASAPITLVVNWPALLKK